jgi:hypothetical protein
VDELIIENVRCFAGEHRVPLRPLTLLVGENSTGKSTFLALARLAWRVLETGTTPDFNEEPFLLGAFEQIVHRNGVHGKNECFSLGAAYVTDSLPVRLFEQRGLGSAVRMEVQAVFRDAQGQPALSGWTGRLPRDEYEIEYWGLNGNKARIEARGPGKKLKKTGKGPFDAFLRAFTPSLDEEPEVGREVLYRLRFLRGIAQAAPIACAPIRSKPKRTYDPMREAWSPEGEHIPMLLSRLSGKTGWASLSSDLAEYGKSAGLWEDIEVKRKGKTASDPFQLHVKIGRQEHNLIDVGYGVSQALPLLIDSIEAPKGATLLLQQPEVHLHPRAQAALGTFLGKLAKRQKKRFLVETHSDHLIDRIRMDVRDAAGKDALKPEDVLLLYFERERNHVNIHPIHIGPNGELLDVPAGYRSFFLAEERRLLGL